jgi:aryl-alcohol dehydrogenase-like predicted oxidoreductase
MREIIIGGAQFGHEYGTLANIAFPGRENRIETLQACLDCGFKRIDLSLNYKGAIENLGDTGISQLFSYNTKFNYKNLNPREILDQLNNSLEILGVKKYQSILVHDWYELSTLERIEALDFLSALENLGIADSIGISVYEESELSPKLVNLGIIQAPLNFFNLEFLNSTLVSELVSAGVEMQARSIFLQGLLLDSHQVIRNPFFQELEEFANYVKFKKSTELEVALEVYDSQRVFTSLVVGFLNAAHVKQLFDLELRDSDILDYLRLKRLKPEFADPRKWRKSV